jgi:hypothetical protein
VSGVRRASQDQASQQRAWRARREGVGGCVLQSAQTLYMRAAAAGISCGHGHERVKLLALCPRAACLRCSRDTAGRSAVACCLIAQIAHFLHSTAPRLAACEVVESIPKTWYAIARDVEGSAGRNPPELPREIALREPLEAGKNAVGSTVCLSAVCPIPTSLKA